MVLARCYRSDVALAAPLDVLSERTVWERTLHGLRDLVTARRIRFRLVRGLEDRAKGDARRTCGH
jgi:hypothetical protein